MFRLLLWKVSGWRDSNARHWTWKDHALPTELHPHKRETLLITYLLQFGLKPKLFEYIIFLSIFETISYSEGQVSYSFITCLFYNTLKLVLKCSEKKLKFMLLFFWNLLVFSFLNYMLFLFSLQTIFIKWSFKRSIL